MGASLSPHALRGQCVVIAHGDAFHRSYLENVFIGSEAVVTGVERDVAAAVARLEAEPRLDTLVLSPLLPDGQAGLLVGTAVKRGIAILVMEPARSGSGAALPADAVLTAPYAGFQVVNAVVALLAGREALARWRAGPRLRGH